MHAPRAVPAAHAKLRRLCTESAARGGALTTFVAVAKAIGLTPSRITQLFGSGDASAEVAITPETLGNLVRVFNKDGVPVTPDALQLSYEDFAAALSLSLPRSPKPIEESALPARGWKIDASQAYTRLAGAEIHPLLPLNSRPDSYRLVASLHFTPAEYVHDNRVVLVGLGQSVFTFASAAYQIAHNSLLGDSARPHPGITAGHRTITVTASDGAVLQGNPLGEHHLAEIEPAGTGAPSIALILSAPPRAFQATLLDSETGAPLPNPTPSLAKAAIVDLVYRESLASHRDPESGHVRLARTAMHHRLQE